MKQPVVRLIVAVSGVLFVLHGVEGQQAKPPTQYRAGQIWNYTAPPSAQGSVILILKVSPGGKKGTVVHIRINNVPLRCGTVKVSKVSTDVGHLAITEEALRQSTTDMLVADVGKIPESYFDPSKDWGQPSPEVITRPLSKIKIIPPSAGLICDEIKGRQSIQ